MRHLASPDRTRLRALALLLLVALGVPGLGSCERKDADDDNEQESTERATGATEKAEKPEKPEKPAVASALPGASPLPAAVHEAIQTALERKREQTDVEFRTHHKTDDGLPLFTNRLVMESSPYLQQHAHNPVDWQPWGDEAFREAAEEGRPVLLSVGYSTCHWCHVMEEESFEDLEIAAYINANYVPIKVDREERPDVDDTYMTAVRMLTGRGGWPMTLWLTPDRLPFMGGTYFPPRSGVRGARVGFLELLQKMKAEYVSSPAEVAGRAQELALKVRAELQSSVGEPGGRKAGLPDTELSLRRAVDYYKRSADRVHGGFGPANKFPMPSRLHLLLRYHRRAGDVTSLAIATKTLDAMANGGIYDHVGGGFHRYTTEPRWMIPHFEKMLYDNAQLARLYTDAWQATGDPDYRRVVAETLDYLDRDMRSPGGALYAATDADSEGEEGLFFLWTPDEMREVLEPDEAQLVLAYYDVTAAGNFEGANILHTPRPRDEVARELALSREEFDARLTDAREKLYRAREKRIHPHRDEKILTAWNGLALDAFARAGLVFDVPRWRERAEAIANQIVTELRDEGRGLLRSRTMGRPGPTAFSEDYAFAIAGFLTLFEATGDPRWLDEAVALQAIHLRRFWDNEAGAFFQTAHDAERLLGRQKPGDDGAVPSANGVAALNLLRLHQFTLDASYERRALDLLEAFGPRLGTRGASMPQMLAALDFHDEGAREIALLRPSPGAVDPLLDVYRGSFQPNTVLVVAAEAQVETLGVKVPWLARKTTREGRTTGYVCRDFSCKAPTTDPEVFANQIAAVEPLGGRRSRPTP